MARNEKAAAEAIRAEYKKNNPVETRAMRLFACRRKVLEYAGGHQLGVLEGQTNLRAALHRQYLIAKYSKLLGEAEFGEITAK